jgi:hypothetical protein
MHINEIEALAMRLRSLIRRADTFGHSRSAILEEVSFVARDLEKQVNQLDREMDEMYLNSLADHHTYAMGK